jgi:DNA-binding response OmpR family regulator
MPTRVLISDDDSDLVEGLQWYLEDAGFEVHTAASGPEALACFRALHPEVVVLDIMMPGLDGVQVCATIRQESEAFILMLSARDGELDKVRALQKGADDYVTKPFFASELAARIHAHLRRARRPEAAPPTYRWQGLQLFLEERRVVVADQPVALSTTEFNLLAILLKRPRVVFPREKLAELLWGDDFVGELRLVDNHVYRVREKLESAGLARCPIATVRGVGYAFRPDE